MPEFIRLQLPSRDYTEAEERKFRAEVQKLVNDLYAKIETVEISDSYNSFNTNVYFSFLVPSIGIETIE